MNVRFEFDTRRIKKNERRQHMANLGISNAHVNQFDGSKRAAKTRQKIQTAIHVVLFSAAFLFVAAIVCGIVV